MKIAAKNITLRPPNSSDFDLLFHWENHPDVLQFNTEEKAVSKEVLTKFLSSIHDIHLNRQLRLMICYPNELSPIGTLDVFNFDTEHKCYGLGVIIFESENRRKGYATEAIESLIEYSRKHWPMEYIYCNVDRGNKTSNDFFLSLGFELVDTEVEKDWGKLQLDDMNLLVFEL